MWTQNQTRFTEFATRHEWGIPEHSPQPQRPRAKLPTWLRIVAWTFKIAGFVMVPIAASALVAVVVGEPPMAPLNLSWWTNLLITASSAGLLLRIGFLLGKRSREAGVALLLLALYPFPLALLTQQPIKWGELVFITVQLALVASIWPLLSPGNETSRESNP